MGALFGGRASQLVSLDELWISSSSAANRKLPWQETCFRMSCMGKLSAAQVLFTRECCSSCEWHWCAVIGRATCFNCGLYRGIGHRGLCSAVKETCAYQCAGFARCICVCVCVCAVVRRWWCLGVPSPFHRGPPCCCCIPQPSGNDTSSIRMMDRSC